MFLRDCWRAGVLSLALVAGVATIAPTTARGGGLDPESNVDGFDPAGDLYNIGETRRLNAIARQLELTRQMLFQNGYNPSSPPIRQPIGYESGQRGPNHWFYRPLYGDEACPVETEVAPETLPGPELLPAPQPSETLPSKPLPDNRLPSKRRVKGPAPANAQPGDFIPPQEAPELPLPLPRGREF